MKPKNILALTYWSHKDALIQSYTLPYLRMIKKHLPPDSHLYLFTLEQSHLKMGQEEARQIKAALAAEGIHSITFNYSKFGLLAAAKWQFFLAWLVAFCYRKRITHLHAWGTPAGGVAYVLSKLTGCPLILDSFEPHAESMVEVGHWRRDSVGFRLLFLLEKWQARSARAVIATTQGMKVYARERYGVELQNFYAKPAGVDLNLFSVQHVKDAALLEKYGLTGKIVCVYAGKIGGIYLRQEIFDFFKAASDYWGERFRVLLLTDAARAEVEELARRSGLELMTIISKFVPHQEVARHMGLGDFAINPVRTVSTKRYCTSIKDGEYWAMGLPIVIPPHISDDSDIIREQGIGSVLQDFTPASYLRAVKEIDDILQSHSTSELYEKIRAVAVKYRSYENAEKIYQEIYDPLNETQQASIGDSLEGQAERQQPASRLSAEV